MDNNIYEPIKKLIETSKFLDDKQKAQYLDVMNKLEKGSFGDSEDMMKMNEYLENELRHMEDMAITAEDADLISALADVRNARVEMQKQVLGL